MKRILVLFTVLMLTGFWALAQSKTVTGIVKDESGAPVPFATVTESGTRNATTADANGNFEIKMKENGSLTFSATGYNSAKTTPEGKNVTVALKRNNLELSTVVVTTALGQQREAKELGYAQTTINNKTLTA